MFKVNNNIVLYDNVVELELIIGTKVVLGECILTGNTIKQIIFVYDSSNVDTLILIKDYLDVNNIKYDYIDENGNEEGLVFITLKEEFNINEDCIIR